MFKTCRMLMPAWCCALDKEFQLNYSALKKERRMSDNEYDKNLSNDTKMISSRW